MFIPRPWGSLRHPHGLSANRQEKTSFRARTEECGRLTLSCRMLSYDRADRFDLHSASAALERLTPVKPVQIFGGETTWHRIRKPYLRLGHF